MRRVILAAVVLLGATGALAAGTSSPAPPAPPAADLSALPATASVRPQNADGTPHQVHARLIADREVVHPGETFRLGVHLTQAGGWHTYWRSPGDIGLPTAIAWSLPGGATASPFAFPTPQRFELSGIVSYGYTGQVLLFSEVVLPATLPAGKAVLGADVTWLACKETCIPGKAKLALPLEVRAKGSPEEGRLAPLFDHFAAQLPTREESLTDIRVEAALSASAVEPEAPFRAAFLVRATGGAPLAPPPPEPWPTFTPIVEGEWMVTGVAVRPVGGGILVLVDGETFAADPPPAGERVGGLLQVRVGETWVRTEVGLDLPRVAPGAAVTPSSSPLWDLASDPPEGGSSGGCSHHRGGAELALLLGALAAAWTRARRRLVAGAAPAHPCYAAVSGACR